MGKNKYTVENKYIKYTLTIKFQQLYADIQVTRYTQLSEPSCT